MITYREKSNTAFKGIMMNQKLKISKEVLNINPFKSKINENLLDKAFRELDETEDIEDFIYNLNNSKICSDVSESKFPVGSSAKIIVGSLTKARATATLCFWPPDNSSSSRSSRPSKPTRLSTFMIFS